ncbi:hypothetical protein GOFOIKOB_3746 [Methylobacterium tardum]|jgi:signal transduction histidine kinase|uniref:Histidine kinase n=1 Tax=Methylobacterium tardum TaxID=374432 RepID=A0AA37THH3_9HYPH|nr:hypothetical protein [Methylobacterium tardum]URD38955.1 hypothetical protein M6G65_11380 [Methylobacterium tardum]GJE50694.1 hypothetical protein GOFOIKOB_3746 [Methylobacterium tardum]GLS68418.1 hypothetical protein GCM10007890_04300 [Methylobacterium tardum]
MLGAARLPASDGGPDASLEIVGDPDLLHLAVSNLLSNGFKDASDSDPV